MQRSEKLLSFRQKFRDLISQNPEHLRALWLKVDPKGKELSAGGRSVLEWVLRATVPMNYRYAPLDRISILDLACSKIDSQLPFNDLLKASDTSFSTHFDRAEDTVEVWLDFFHVFGVMFSDETIFSWVAQQFLFSLGTVWTKANKDVYSRWFSRLTRQEEPPPLPYDTDPPVEVCHQLKLKGRNSGRRGATFLNSLLHGLKKGLPRVPDDDLVAGLYALKDRLSQVKDVDEDILVEVDRTSREIFLKQDPPGIEQPLSTSVLSMNSCTSSGRSSGGVTGEWLRRSLGGSIDTSFFLGIPDLVGHSVDGLKIRYLYGCSAWQFLNPIPWMGEEEEDIRAMAIPEPCKVRVITINTFETSASGASLLRWLRRGMSRFDCFQLTREKISLDAVNRVVTGLKSGEVVRSADFSAATDEFPLALSRACVRSFPPSIRVKIQNALCGKKTLHFKWPGGNALMNQVKADLPEPFEVTNGQLMGCMYSFPFLCATNAAILRMSFEQYYGRTFKLRELPPFLVNGDDLLFRGPSGLIKIWMSNVARAGLKLSPGKNYDSDRFLVMNSHMYPIHTFHDFESGRSVSYVPYLTDTVNMGLVTGRQKGWGEEELEFPDRAYLEGYTRSRLLSKAWWTNFEKLYEIRGHGMVARISEVLERRVGLQLTELNLYSRVFFPHLTPRCEDWTTYWKVRYLVDLNSDKVTGGHPRDGSWNLLCWKTGGGSLESGSYYPIKDIMNYKKRIIQSREKVQPTPYLDVRNVGISTGLCFLVSTHEKEDWAPSSVVESICGCHDCVHNCVDYRTMRKVVLDMAHLDELVKRLR